MSFPRPFLLSLMASFIGLTACGGGGSSSPTPTPGVPVPTPSPAPTEQVEHLSGGTTSVTLQNANAFSEPSRNLTDSEKIIQFNLGNDFFENPWVEGSASTSSRDGLGALFNNNACQDCHVRDGRGHAPNVSATEEGTDFSSTLIRAARSDISAAERLAMQNSEMANVPDTSVGGQLQHDAISDVRKEVQLSVSYSPVVVTFDDGEEVRLRKPDWQIVSEYASEGYDFNSDTVFSARVAPQMVGLGLLAMIADLDILANADETDENGDGISGRPNYVWSVISQRVELGRFGWKAGQPSLIEQAAGAFLNDMGLTSRLHQQEPCMAHQSDCIQAPNGNGDSIEQYDYEVPDRVLDAIAFYSAHLSVPQRRNAYSENVQAGKVLFNDAGCTDCHVAEYTTQTDADFPELSAQKIFPYTDMLLHDMGDELADFTLQNQPVSDSVATEFLANGREWRTPPLWGIGLAKTVDPQATFLHDGRARTIMEAVLWHGGEAEHAKQAVLNMSSNQRVQLLDFLNDL